jgi:hypothetical protein
MDPALSAAAGRGCQIVYFYTKNTDLFLVFSEGLVIENVDIFKAILYILL